MKKEKIASVFKKQGYAMEQKVHIVTPSGREFNMPLASAIQVVYNLSEQGLQLETIEFVSETIVVVTQSKDDVDYRTHFLFYPEI